jgi:hypothetical protein
MMEDMGITEAEYVTSVWTEERARLAIGHTAGSKLITTVIGVPEIPTERDLRGEASGIERTLRIIGNSEFGNIPSIRSAWAEELAVNTLERLPLAA